MSLELQDGNIWYPVNLTDYTTDAKNVVTHVSVKKPGGEPQNLPLNSAPLRLYQASSAEGVLNVGGFRPVQGEVCEVEVEESSNSSGSSEVKGYQSCKVKMSRGEFFYIANEAEEKKAKGKKGGKQGK